MITEDYCLRERLGMVLVARVVEEMEKRKIDREVVMDVIARWYSNNPFAFPFCAALVAFHTPMSPTATFSDDFVMLAFSAFRVFLISSLSPPCSAAPYTIPIDELLSKE